MDTDTALVLVAALVLLGAFTPGSAVASHGDDSTEFRVTPDNRDTEASDVRYAHEVTLTDNFGNGQSGIEEPTSIQFSTTGVDVGGCEAAAPLASGSYTLRVGGEEFSPDEESFDGGTASFSIEEPEPDYRVGETLVLELEDCVTNPSAEGWYQTDVVVEGKAFGSDEQVRLEATSHYFAICDGCENDSDARSELGPPPSEPTATPTPTPTATPTPTPTPTPEPTPEPTPIPDDEPTPTAGDDPTPEPTPTPDDDPTASPTPTTTPGDRETVFGTDPMVIVGVVAAVSIGIAVFGATRL